MATFVPNSEDITIYRGDDARLAYLFTDNSTPRDLSNWDNFEMVVRRDEEQPPLITTAVVVNNNSAVQGQVIVQFDENDFSQTHLSSIGVYELKGVYTNPDLATDTRTQTLAVGGFNITDDVS